VTGAERGKGRNLHMSRSLIGREKSRTGGEVHESALLHGVENRGGKARLRGSREGEFPRQQKMWLKEGWAKKRRKEAIGFY